jgi:lipopolysaccharide biosynthesis glycosyltransferase
MTRSNSQETRSCWDLVSGFDDTYLWPFLVNMYSGSIKSTKQIRRIVLTTPNGLNNLSRRLISDTAEMLGIKLEFRQMSLPENLPISDHFTSSTYLQLTAAEQFTENFVYMDVDIILELGWDEIVSFESIPKGFVSRATIEPISVLHDYLSNEAVKKAGDRYFNSGVMQIDPKAFRLISHGELSNDLIRNYSKMNFKYVNQCILNYLLVEHNIPLAKEFNLIPGFWNTSTLATGKIIHFAGRRKPWTVPTMERNRIFACFRVHNSDYSVFVRYWKLEKELLYASKLHSRALFNELKVIRKSNIKKTEISFRRFSERVGWSVRRSQLANRLVHSRSRES